jgi:hypothetical protein
MLITEYKGCHPASKVEEYLMSFERGFTYMEKSVIDAGPMHRDQALKKTALDEYNARVEHHVAKLIRLLEKTE